MTQINNNYTAASQNEMEEVAARILKDIEHPLILFIGDLGAGKTTLIKAILSHLRSDDTGSSPSYALINEYHLPQGKAFHIDLYRLEDPGEAFNLGIEEILYSGSYCFVEWPQLILEFIDEPYHIVKILVGENNERIITLL